MNNTFKTLTEARTAYEALELETADLRLKVAGIAAIEAQLTEAKAFLADAMHENEDFTALIVQKDGEIGVKTDQLEDAKTEIAGLRMQISELEKGKKTVKQQARELVAATGGAPVQVDQSEIAKMQAGSEAEMAKAMLAEHDPIKLGQLYDQYNQLFRKPKNKR